MDIGQHRFVTLIRNNFSHVICIVLVATFMLSACSSVPANRYENSRAGKQIIQNSKMVDNANRDEQNELNTHRKISRLQYVDEYSGEVLVSIFSKKPVNAELLDECINIILESQRRVENGEVRIELPKDIPNSIKNGDPMPHMVLIEDEKSSETLVSISVSKQAEPEAMNQVLKTVHDATYGR